MLESVKVTLDARASKTSLRRMVSDEIQALILGGTWREGSRLPGERALAEQLGVSRTVVREALKALAARGVVTEVPRKGTWVSRGLSETLGDVLQLAVSQQGMRGRLNLYEVRSWLEVEIAGLAAERATDGEIADLEIVNEILARMNRENEPWSEERLRHYNHLEFQFHIGLARCSKNELLVVLLSALFGALDKTWSNIHAHCETRQGGVELHRGILDAIRSRDPRRARKAVRENLKAFLHAIENETVRFKDRCRGNSSPVV